MQMKNYFEKVKFFVKRNRVRIAQGAVGLVTSAASYAFADGSGLTLPALPTTDLEAAGTTVLGLVAAYVIILLVIRTFKKV